MVSFIQPREMEGSMKNGNQKLRGAPSIAFEATGVYRPNMSSRGNESIRFLQHQGSGDFRNKDASSSFSDNSPPRASSGTGGGTPASRSAVFCLIALGFFYIFWKNWRDSQRIERDNDEKFSTKWDDIVQYFRDKQIQMVRWRTCVEIAMCWCI